MLHLLHVTMLHENYFTWRLVGSMFDVSDVGVPE